MTPITQLTFGRFRLDTTNECLWDGARAISLRPKAFAVLKHLVAYPGQLVTKQQLLEAVWPSTFVGDAVLKDSIRQLREALGDDAGAPRFIETAHRRGYRFIGEISQARAHADAMSVLPAASAALLPESPSPTRPRGRETELASLRRWLEHALRGERQVVFVTGEAGIGKTTVVNALVEQVAAVEGVRVVRGQCLEHYGDGEAYLPVLDGFARLCRAPGGERIIELLRQYAPAWLLQLPSLLSAAERQALRQQVQGATREQMLREMADAVDAIASEALLVVVLEDLHWSDYSTLDLVAFLARRCDRACLMVVGTYRPVEVIVGEHPLKSVKRELQAHALCRELPLEYLTEEAVAEFLTVRCPGHQLPRSLVRMIHRRTEGNPLFMVNAVDHLIDEGVIVEQQGRWQLRSGLTAVESGIPESVRQLIETQIDRLSPDERRVLESASVVGMECSSVAIAAGLDEQTGWVEEICEALTHRHRFLSPATLVVLPDGTITPRYTFRHVVHLDVLYRLLAPMRRAQIHRRIGERGEIVYGDRVGEIAAELAMHFEQGRDGGRAVTYLLQAAENATDRSAHHEAAALARRGLAALDTLPDLAERVRLELKLRLILGVSLVVTKGFAAADVEELYRRAWQLCGEDADSAQAFRVLRLMGLCHMFRAELHTAHEIAERLMELALGLNDLTLVMEAHRALGGAAVELATLSDAVTHLDKASALYDGHRHHAYVSFSGHDPKVISDCAAARALWALGYPDQALERVTRALTLARQLAHVQSVVSAAFYTAHVHLLRGEFALTEEHAAAAVALADEHGLELWAALGRIHQAWAAIELGQADAGLQRLRHGLTSYEATGARVWQPHFLGLLAKALAGAGCVEDGLSAAEEGLTLARDTGEMYFAAELHRIKGEVFLARASNEMTSPFVAEAEACFTQALNLARAQQAKSWELRVATNLGLIYRRQGRDAAARQIVSKAYAWFTEGYETADLTAARAFCSS
jgi:DNA-binding winged helix-turn-helix (wHTH) protein/predicted ATPase